MEILALGFVNTNSLISLHVSTTIWYVPAHFIGLQSPQHTHTSNKRWKQTLLYSDECEQQRVFGYRGVIVIINTEF